MTIGSENTGIAKTEYFMNELVVGHHLDTQWRLYVAGIQVG
jgi:hypothetical protein